MAACAGSKKPSELFLEFDIVPSDSRRVSGSKELLRNRAPRKKTLLHQVPTHVVHTIYFKRAKIMETLMFTNKYNFAT